MKRVVTLVVIAAVAVVCVAFGPALYNKLTGNGGITWVTMQLEAKLSEQNSLWVYRAEIPGVDTVTQSAVLYNAWTCEMPYTYQINYYIDLSSAAVRAEDRNGDGTDDVLRIYVQPVYADNDELTINEADLKITDPFNMVSAAKITSLRNELKAKLREEYSVYPAYLDSAWESAKGKLTQLLDTVLSEIEQDEFFDVEIIQGDPPALETPAPGETTVPAASPAA